MQQVDLTPLAQADLEEIWSYVGADSEFQADRLLRRMAAKFHHLARNNTLGRPRPELARDCRSFPLGSYCIYYRPTESGILLLRVLHSARDIGQLGFPE